jgi:[ribosomal protein S5]-alanine N-acetyltransferase
VGGETFFDKVAARVMPRSEPYFLKSARLGFSHWTKDDLPLALAIWGDPAVTRFVGGPFSPEQVAQRLDREIASQRNYNLQYWPIFLLTTGDHVGCAGMRVYKLEEKIPSMGYYLRPKFWGQGFATEAGRAVISCAFNTLGASALFAGHHPENASSRKVLAKLGFRFTHKQLYPPTGLDHDSYLLQRTTVSSS